MSQTNTLKLVKKAFKAQKLDRLLLGNRGNQVLPPRSPALGNTDLAFVFQVIYDHLHEFPLEDLRQSLVDAIYSIVECYEGIEPAAVCILMECLKTSPNRTPIGLPLDEIAERVRHCIETHRVQLVQDQTGIGFGWPDGRMRDLRRISGIIAKNGGPAFVS